MLRRKKIGLCIHIIKNMWPHKRIGFRGRNATTTKEKKKKKKKLGLGDIREERGFERVRVWDKEKEGEREQFYTNKSKKDYWLWTSGWKYGTFEGKHEVWSPLQFSPVRCTTPDSYQPLFLILFPFFIFKQKFFCNLLQT